MKLLWPRFVPCILLTLISAHFLAAQPPDRPAAGWVVKPGNPILIEPVGEQVGTSGSIAFSPDRSLLATGSVAWEGNGNSRKGMVLLWDARTGTARGELHGHADVVRRILFSPDGRQLVTHSQDGAIFIWDVATKTLRRRLSEGTVQSRNPRDIAAMMRQPRLMLGDWSPDGTLLLTQELKFDLTAKPAKPITTIKLFDAATGKLVRSLPPFNGITQGIVWSGDGKSLLFASYQQGEGKVGESFIEVVDAQSGEVRRRLARHTESRQHVSAFSHDARYAVLHYYVTVPGSQRPSAETVSLWDMENDRAVWTQTLPAGSLRGVTFSDDDKSLVAANADNEIVVRDVLTGEVRQTLPTSGCSEIGNLAVSGDKQRIAFSEMGSTTITLWKLDEALPTPRYTSQTVFRDVSNVRALAWPESGLRAASEISDFSTDLRVGKELLVNSLKAPGAEAQQTTIPEKRLMNGGTLSPDGRLLAIEVGIQPKPAYFETEGIAIYDLEAGKLVRILPEKFGVASIEWAPDGKTLATNTYNNEVTLWNAESGQTLGVLQTKANAVAWSPDGRTIAAGSETGSIHLFEVESSREMEVWQVQGTVRTLAFAPDGKTLAVGATLGTEMERGDSFVRLFDVGTGKETRAFQTQPVLRDMHWTPDGKAIGASSYPDPNRASNGELRVWDATTGKELVAIDDRCGMGEFAFSPDGSQVATHNWDRVRVWKVK